MSTSHHILVLSLIASEQTVRAFEGWLRASSASASASAVCSLSQLEGEGGEGRGERERVAASAASMSPLVRWIRASNKQNSVYLKSWEACWIRTVGVLSYLTDHAARATFLANAAPSLA